MYTNVNQNVSQIFSKYPEVKLVYFFGSRAEGNEGPQSDYDFAVYLAEKDKKKMFEIKFLLMDEIARFLGTDKVDLVILNITESPEIKYEIIKNGKLVYEEEPYRIMIEPRILNEYFDYREWRKRRDYENSV